jgi:hypothetical protein
MTQDFQVAPRRNDAAERAIRAGMQIAKCQLLIEQLSKIRQLAMAEMAETMSHRDIGKAVGVSAARVTQILGAHKGGHNENGPPGLRESALQGIALSARGRLPLRIAPGLTARCRRRLEWGEGGAVDAAGMPGLLGRGQVHAGVQARRD